MARGQGRGKAWRSDLFACRLSCIVPTLGIRRHHTNLTQSIATYLAKRFWSFRESLTVGMRMEKVQQVMHHCIRLVTKSLQRMHADPDMRSSLLHWDLIRLGSPLEGLGKRRRANNSRYVIVCRKDRALAHPPVEAGNFCGKIPALHSNDHSVLALPPRRSRDEVPESL